MKKIILSISIAAIAIAGFMYEPASENQTSNDLTLENAEALAGSNEKWPATCWQPGDCVITDEVDWETVYVYPGDETR